MPLAMVAATDRLKKAPTKLSIADRATAVFGLSAPVEMGAAIELAVSWKPLVKSNARAVTTTMTSMRVPGSTTVLPATRTQRDDGHKVT
jgi:hypothetical protein